MVDLNPVAKDVHSATIRWLRKIPPHVRRAQMSRIGRLRPDSREAADRSSPVGLYVGMLASIKIAIATDHLDTLLRATRADTEKPVVPTYAHYSLLRGAFESSIYARWLTEREVSSRQRLARGIELMFQDLKERQSAEGDVPTARAVLEATGSDAGTRIAELTTAAEEAGIVRSGDPGLVALARSYALCGDGFDAYHVRFMAGVLHGTAWAAISGDHVDTQEIDAESSRVKMEADPLKTWYVTRCAVRAYLGAIATFESYVGQ